MKKVYIVGGGPGNLLYMTERAKSALSESEIIVSSSHFAHLGENESRVRYMKLSEMESFIKSSDYSVLSVLVSGDTGFYSLASSLKDKLENCTIEFIPGVGSLQYLSAVLKTDYRDIKLVSLHGKKGFPVPFVNYNKRVFFLTGGDYTSEKIIRELFECGLSDASVTVGERLSFDDEKITVGTPASLLNLRFDPLSVLLIENSNFTDKYSRLSDDVFLRDRIPMTKESVRVLSVNMLNIHPSDTVWDIGSGTGSVSVYLARHAFESMVWAVEKRAEAVKLLKENINRTKTFNIRCIEGSAPKALETLPPPDKVFIGGSTGSLADIISCAVFKNPNAVFVVNAVTVETFTQAVECFKELDFDVEIVSAGISVSEKMGSYHMMRAQNNVFIIKGVRKNAV